MVGVQKYGRNIVHSKNLNCIPCNQIGCDDSFNSDYLNDLGLDSIKNNIREIVISLI
mgnify:CR=1 FL=1|jgi:hypothetical protein